MTPDRKFDAAFASIFGLPNGLLPTVQAPDPLAAHESEHGMCAGLDVIGMNNEGIEDVRDSAIRAEETGEIRRTDYRGDNA